MRAHAESHKVLLVQVGSGQWYTAEPFHYRPGARSSAARRAKARLVVASLQDTSRATVNADLPSRRAANKSGAQGGFWQLRAAGGASHKQLDANDQKGGGGGLAVAVRVRSAPATSTWLRREHGVIQRIISSAPEPTRCPPAGVMNDDRAHRCLGAWTWWNRRRPQDGRIKTLVPPESGAAKGDEVSRLSTLPTATGEKLVMRISTPSPPWRP
jgi:general secretion pathway protein E